MDKGLNAEADPVVMDEMNEPAVPAIRPPLGVGKTQEFTGNLSLPYLGMAYGVGGLSEAGFAPGSLVLGKEHLLAEKGEPIRLIVMSFEEYFKEYVTSAEWTAGKRPRVFRTEEEAKAAGLSTRYNQDTGQLPQAPQAMVWTTLIEKPEKVTCPLFCIEANGKAYAPAYFPLERSAYGAVRQDFGMAVKFILKARGIHTGVWSVHTVLKTAKTGNKTWVPKISLVEHLTAEQEATIKAALAA